MKSTLLFTVCLLLISCVSTEGIPKFETMNKEELAAYNEGKPVSQMIVCGEDERNFSRVRRRVCMTVDAMYGSVEKASELDVLHSIPGYSQ